MADSMHVFDRRLVRGRRDRAAGGLAGHDFLLREVAERLADRLADVTREFPVALDLGCHSGILARALNGRGGVRTLVQSDFSPRMAATAAHVSAPLEAPAPLNVLTLAADEEALPFASNSFDLVMSCLSLHWVNDLPGALLQIKRCLKPDGLFLAAWLGGETLRELRASWMEAELGEEDGAGVHVSPFADVRDAGMLLQRAGFALPVTDAERLVVRYGDAIALMHDLRGMGEANAALVRRRTFTRRGTLARMAALYDSHYAEESRVPATFDIVYLTGWAPHETQPKPLRPGSAAARLADALDSVERPAGDKTPRR